MAITYVPISSTTLGSVTSTIDFTSIPATYTDLKLIFTFFNNGSGGNAYPNITVNNDSSSSLYSLSRNYASGSALGSQDVTNSSNWAPGAAVVSTNNLPVTYIMDFYGYAGNTYKTGIIDINQDANGSGWKMYDTVMWRSTTAINQITLVEQFGAGFGVGTRATLYGILAA